MITGITHKYSTPFSFLCYTKKFNDGLTKAQRYALKHADELKERRRLYRQRPEVKAKAKAYSKTPQGKTSVLKRTDCSFSNYS